MSLSSKRKFCKMDELINRKNIYNSTFEISIRVLVLLKIIEKEYLSIDELMIYDYLTLNSYDVGGPASLHAPVPNRGVQVFSKKNLIKESISFLLSKELVVINNNENGIFYAINNNGMLLLEYFESDYYKKLLFKIRWVNSEFGMTSRKELDQFVKSNISEWGAEFMAQDNFNNRV